MTDKNQPATKQDLLDLEEGLTEKIRDMQAEVLRAFYNGAGPLEIKLRTLTLIDERLGLLEERVGRMDRERLRSH